MRKIDKFEKINEERFKRVVGVKRATLYHMGIDYGISEGQASKLVRDVESVLIKSGKFSL
jgi:hypothetical protein